MCFKMKHLLSQTKKKQTKVHHLTTVISAFLLLYKIDVNTAKIANVLLLSEITVIAFEQKEKYERLYNVNTSAVIVVYSLKIFFSFF